MRIARVVLGIIFALVFTAAAARADGGPAPAQEVYTLALLRLTSAPGDKLIEELCRGALKDTHRWSLVKTAPGADYLGKLEIARRNGVTELTLTVSKHEALLVRAHQSIVTAEQSMIDGMESLVAQVSDALDGKQPRVQTPPPEQAGSPVEPLPRPAPRKVKRIDEEGWGPGQDKEPAKDDDDDDKRHLDLVIGLEAAFGPMSLDSNSIAAGAQNGFDLTHYATAFTQTIDGHAHAALALHAGTKFLGWGAFEIAYQGSRWSGGASTLLGPRLSFFPLAAIWPKRKLELGIDLGYGYSFFSGSSYDMTGTYFALGVTFEYPITPSFGVVAYWRLFTPFLKNFYYDYSRNLSEPVGGATAIWNTFGLGFSWHPTIRW